METELDIVNTTNSNITAVSNDSIDSPTAITLELGDVIEIVSPANSEYHETTNYIQFIDNTQIKLLNVATLNEYQLNITENGSFSDESITQIILLSRSNEKGYARQNNLLPSTWIDIHFGGEVPTIITGQINNLEEDMVEIITYPDMKTIYIDFKYQGIPLNIPIQKIIIREKPASIKNMGSLSMMKDAILSGEEYVEPEESAEITFTETGESIISVPENKQEDKSIKNAIEELYTDANTITFGKKLEEISQLVELPENEQRYDIDVQINDMMDELLSTVPNSERTKTVLDNIHNLIKRYTELRKEYSKFDENNNVYDKKVNTSMHKPLVEKLFKLNNNLSWLIPVVSNRKKLNITNTQVNTPDIAFESMAETHGTIIDMNNRYKRRGANDEAITYNYIQNLSQEIHRPFENPIDNTSCITTKEVLNNIDAVVDNLNEYYSSVYNESGFKKRKFLIQRYNLGSHGLNAQIQKSGKKVFVREPITQNDEMCVKSFLFLPTPVIKFSEINLPTTSMLTRSNLHDNYLLLFRLLRTNTEISTQVIDDFSKELDYEKIEENAKESIFNGINEFIINNDAYESIEYMDNDEKFRKFLEVIIPKTRSLIRLYRKHIKNRLSLVGIVQKLEPFMIYPNDLTYKQYMEIRFFIKEQIKELKQRFGTVSNDMSRLSKTEYNVDVKVNTILRVLSENNDFSDTFFKSYKFLDIERTKTKLSATEILLQMLAVDNAELYTKLISSILIRLNSRDSVLAKFQEPAIDELDDYEKIKSNDCNQRYLSKKYTSIADLQKDNNVEEIYFDEEFDDTPYTILEKYVKEQKEMANDLFIDFLTENLIQRHNASSETARELAETLVLKKKKVLDDHYAMVVIYPNLKKEVDFDKLSDEDKKLLESETDMYKKTFYYRRKKDNWIKDDEISIETFVDNNSLFCNLTDKCLKNTTNKICETPEQIRIRMKDVNKSALVNEFEKRYELTIEELEEKLNAEINQQLKIINKNDILREIQLYKANNLGYELGKLVRKNESLESPHVKLRELIMGQNDFAKKQDDICKYVDKYCREALVDNLNEKPAWYYCKDTNTELFPVSIHRLAQSYIIGNNYAETLDKICAEYGTESDDGDCIIDKYTSYVLRKMDYSTEEGYDAAGYRVKTRDILEKDLGVVVADNLKQKDRIFEDEETEMIYNVCKSVCNNIDVPCDKIEEMVLRYSKMIIDKEVFNKNRYDKLAQDKIKKTGKQMSSYETYKNEMIITIVGSIILIAIQTATPSFKTNKTFPNCVRSFSGYPMTGMEDTTGINYIACVLIKMKSSIPPWDTMKTMKTDKLKSRIETVLDKIMKINELQELYVIKKDFILLNPELVAPEEHKIEKWVHFLPPVIPIKVLASLKNIGTDFRKDMKDKMKKGDPNQDKDINIIKSKNIHHSYAIIETINDIVKDKDTLLKTASQIPFVENACCNESNKLTNPIIYFNNENQNIKVYLQRIVKNEKILQSITNLSKARYFNHAESTVVHRPDPPTNVYSDEIIYSTFIYYCNLDKDLPIPNKFKAICGNIPEGYNSKWDLVEKIEFFKKSGKRFTSNQLHQLMSIVHENNMVDKYHREPISQIMVFKDIIENLELTNSELFEEPLRNLLRKILDEYDPAKVYDTPSESLDNLTNYLIRVNRNYFKTIMEFIDHNSNTVSPKEYNSVGEFLLNIHNWNIGKQSVELQLHSVGHFLQTAITNICKVYPIVISNNSDFFKNICKHWGFSDYHNDDILRNIQNYYNNIEKFKGDTVIVRLLQEMNTKLIDVCLFSKNIPISSEIQKSMKNEKDEDVMVSFHSLLNNNTYYELIKYCFYRMLIEFISSSEDPDLLRSEIHSIKSIRREHNNSINNTSDNISSVYNSTEEAHDNIINELEESEVIVDTPDELKSRICSLLVEFIKVEIENKNVIDMPYVEIIKKINRSKEREKKSIIDYLGKMSREERKVEELFKQYKLGRWNVGNQKGLVHYNKQTFDRERNELLTQLQEDETTGQHEVVTEMRRDIFDIENDEEQQQEEFYDNEANDIEHLPEEYDDGNYYSDDNEEDF